MILEVKMNTRCSEIMDDFFALDKHQRIPLYITAHLLVCKKCRTEVRLMTLTERVNAEPLHISTDDNDRRILQLMQKLDSAYAPSEKIAPISLKRWIVSGIAMVLAMMMFIFSQSTLPNQALSLSFYIVFAVVISAYCALFVGSNMDYFIKKIETFKEI